MDRSVQKSIPKKNRKCRISDSDNDDEDSADGVPNQKSENKIKNRKNNSHDELLERDHDSLRRMTDGGNHWLQDKNRIVLELTGIHLCDQFLPDGLFLNDNNFITTKRATISLPDFERKNSKQILFKKQYQNEQERLAQFKSVDKLDGITGNDGKFINWSDILDYAWDAP